MRGGGTKLIQPAATLLFIAAIVLAHAAITVAATAYATAYFTIRAPNVRLMEVGEPEEAVTQFRFLNPRYDRRDRYDLLAAYVAERFDGAEADQRRVLFVGSSVTWMYPYDEAGSLPARFAALAQDAIVANASIIGSKGMDMAQALCEIARAGSKPDVIFVEVPIINDISAMLRPKDHDDEPSGKCEATHHTTVSYSHFFASRAWGLSLAMLMRDQYDGVDSAVPMSTAAVPETYMFEEEDVHERGSVVRRNFQRLYAAASMFDVPVVFFFSPIYIPAYEKQLVDTGHIESFVDLVMNECESLTIGGPSTCVDFWMPFNEQQEYFSNVSHLNAAGANRLAEILLDAALPLMERWRRADLSSRG